MTSAILPEFTSWPVFRFTRSNQVFSRVLVLSAQDILVLDPFSGNVKTRNAMINLKKVSWDRRNAQLFRLVFVNDEAHIYLSMDRERIISHLLRYMRLSAQNSDSLAATVPQSPAWKAFTDTVANCDYSFLVQGVDSRGHLHSHELWISGRVVRHVDREKSVMFSQHAYDDIAFLRVDRRDRLLLTIEYKNDKAYKFIVSVKDRHLLLSILTGRLFLFQQVMQLLMDEKIPFADVDDAAHPLASRPGSAMSTRSHGDSSFAHVNSQEELVFRSTKPVVYEEDISQQMDGVDIARVEQSANQPLSSAAPPASSSMGPGKSDEQLYLEMMWERLTQPSRLLKHIRKAFNKKNARLTNKAPHERVFLCDYSGYVYWGESGSLPADFSNCVKIVRVLVGDDTIKAFKDMTEDQAQLSFALETASGEIIYLIAQNADDYHVWTAGLMSLLSTLQGFVATSSQDPSLQSSFSQPQAQPQSQPQPQRQPSTNAVPVTTVAYGPDGGRPKSASQPLQLVPATKVHDVSSAPQASAQDDAKPSSQPKKRRPAGE